MNRDQALREYVLRVGHQVMHFDEAGNDLGECALIKLDHRDEKYTIGNCTCIALEILKALGVAVDEVQR